MMSTVSMSSPNSYGLARIENSKYQNQNQIRKHTLEDWQISATALFGDCFTEPTVSMTHYPNNVYNQADIFESIMIRAKSIFHKYMKRRLFTFGS